MSSEPTGSPGDEPRRVGPRLILGPYLTGGQHPPDGQHAPDGQHPSDELYPHGVQYGYDPRFFAPAATPCNRVAVAALVCGIGQFVLGLLLVGNILLAIPAIICGAIALKQTRLRGERGRSMAIVGLVLGILGVVYFAAVLIVIVLGVPVSSHSS
jgi:Domain of unknown function (DUF4190)